MLAEWLSQTGKFSTLPGEINIDIGGPLAITAIPGFLADRGRIGWVLPDIPAPSMGDDQSHIVIYPFQFLRVNSGPNVIPKTRHQVKGDGTGSTITGVQGELQMILMDIS
jgi:hypothetical protein